MIYTPTVASFFSGAGGMDEGFKAAGFHIKACMDIEEWACDTLRANNPKAVIIGPPNFSGDIKKISPSEFSVLSGIEPGSIDVFTGGPPCQPFSQAAAQRFVRGDERFKRRGFDDLEKGTLLFDYIRYIEYFRPKVFLIENVAGLLTLDGGVQLNEALDLLKSLGYQHTEPRILEAAEYGVPQFRKRLIIWGTNVEGIKPELPVPTHGPAESLLCKPYNTVAHALFNLSSSLPNHSRREHKEVSVARYKKLRFGEREKLGRVDRLDPFRPSKTIIAGGTKGGGRSHLHPFIARTTTVREAARLQTFSDDFVFHGSMARQFTQVGNAVPPLLAEHFARQISKQVFNNTFTEVPYFEQSLLSEKSVEEIVDSLWSEARNKCAHELYEN